MEKQLFSQPEGAEWDELAIGTFQFTDVTLIRQIGFWHIGEKFDSAVLNYEEGHITLLRPEGSWRWKLDLRVGAQIPVQLN